METPVQSALAPLIEAMHADGYEASVQESGNRIIFRISEGSAACSDCLSPKSVMVPIVIAALRGAGLFHDVEVRYPSEP